MPVCAPVCAQNIFHSMSALGKLLERRARLNKVVAYLSILLFLFAVPLILAPSCSLPFYLFCINAMFNKQFEEDSDDVFSLRNKEEGIIYHFKAGSERH